jgi:starch synthase
VPPRADSDALAARLALRYGAVPVVGAHGAAVGDVIDQSEARRGNGFVFRDYNAESVLAALQRAFRWQGRPLRWRALQRRGLRQALRFSWARSAENYLALYQQAISFRKEAVTTLTQMLADDPALDSPGSAGGVAGAGQAQRR